MKSAFAAVWLVAPSLLLAQVLRTPEPVPRTRTNIKAFEAFNRAHGNNWQVEWNRVCETPDRISGSSLQNETPVSKETAQKVALDFIGQYHELLGADPASLVLGKADFNPRAARARGSGTWYVDFHQTYHAVPVEGGSVRVIIRGQRITSFGSDFFPGIRVPWQPAVSREAAIEKARRDLGLPISKVPEKPIRADLIVFPDLRASALRYHLAWTILMPIIYGPDLEGDSPKRPREQKPTDIVPIQFRYVIDAISGEIIDRSNLSIPETLNGHLTGVMRPLVPPDPPTTVDIQNMTVTATQGTTPFTWKRDGRGMYFLAGLAPGFATVTATLTGPHTAIHNNEAPSATHTSAPIALSGTHNWDWSVDDMSPSKVEEHSFYHGDRIRQWYLRGAPFNVAPTPDPMDIVVRDGPYCNAYAAPWVLHFGSGTAGCQDFALCSDIFYHEYTHRIVDKVYTDAGVVLPYSGQTGAMNEAWADYFSCSLTNDPSHGEGCYSGRNIDTPNLRYPDNIVGEVHADGIIFSGAIWDTRIALGTTYIDAMALRAMKHATPGFNEYLTAMLEEDDDPSFDPSPLADANLANGTPNIDTICHNYYDLHGIFDSHCAGHTQTPIAIITAPSPLDFNLFQASTTSITITGSAAGSSLPLQSFVLDYAAESAPTTFLTTGITLTVGGTSPVVGATLGSLNISTLADGFYIIRLTVTDTAGVTAVTTTSVVIDRTLMSGWPQSLNLRFRGAPAIANLDPAFPGLEIAARGSDGMLYVWHKDGTLAPGWPKYAGGGLSAPAVGDLDGNGTLEIVIADSWSGNVYAFHQDGTTVTGWPQICSGGSWATPALADLDGDGKLEIIVVSYGNRVCAWHDNGTAVTGWPITTTDKVRSSAAVADLDHDGVPEVVVGSDDGNVYAWHADGTALPGWPKNVGAEVSGSPALGDLDGDGNLEIVVGTRDQKVYVWHHTGIAVTGWPKTVASLVMVPSSAVLADVDGDGILEVIVQSNDDAIHVWRGDGTPVTGWPQTVGTFTGYEFYVASPAIGDIEGNVTREIVARLDWNTAGSYFVNKVYAFHNDATQVTGWPKIISWYAGTSPQLADVDLDGNVDVVAGAMGIFVWKGTGTYSSGPMDWLVYRKNMQRTGANTNAVDQQQPAMNTAAGGLFIGGNSQQKLAQTVTAGVSGTLAEVRMPIACYGGADLILSIEGVTAGKPNGVVRNTQIIPGAGLPIFYPSPPTFRRFVLTTPVALAAGDQFAIILNSTGLTPTSACGIFQGPAGDPYPRGNMYFDSRPNAVGVWVCGCDFTGSAFDLPVITIMNR